MNLLGATAPLPNYVLNEPNRERPISNRHDLRRQYYNLPSVEWDKSYNKGLRNALFKEPLNIRPTTSFSDFQNESYSAMWKRQYSLEKKTEGNEKINCYLKKQYKLSFRDDYYSSCLSSKGSFVSFVAANTLYILQNSKLVMKSKLTKPGEISALQVDYQGNNYVGTVDGNCYEVKEDLQKMIIKFDGNPDFKAGICSMALSNDLLYTTNKAGNINILSLKDNVLRELQSDDFACKILPPLKSDHYFVLGHNANKVTVYDDRYFSTFVHEYLSHNAAVRALAWNPSNPNEIASGGGTADREIHIWDVSTGRLNCKVQTDAQICNLFWNERKGKQYITSVNGLTYSNIKMPSTLRIFKLENNHLKNQSSFDINPNCRPIHSIIDGSDPNHLIVGGKEFLQMWRIFETKPTQNHEWEGSKSMIGKNTIR